MEPPRCQRTYPHSISRSKRSIARRRLRMKRLETLRELFRLLPKHKGTEKLQSDLKQKMSQLREEVEHGKAGGKKGGLSHHVPREGAGQVVLVGAPNVGKSTLAGDVDQCPA